MRVSILSMLAAGAAVAASAIPAAAYDYPYCLQYRSAVPTDCNYRSYAQCQASASGRGASCYVNPRVALQQQRLEYQDGRRYRGRNAVQNDRL